MRRTWTVLIFILAFLSRLIYIWELDFFWLQDRMVEYISASKEGGFFSRAFRRDYSIVNSFPLLEWISLHSTDKCSMLCLIKYIAACHVPQGRKRRNFDSYFSAGNEIWKWCVIEPCWICLSERSWNFCLALYNVLIWESISSSDFDFMNEVYWRRNVGCTKLRYTRQSVHGITLSRRKDISSFECCFTQRLASSSNFIYFMQSRTCLDHLTAAEAFHVVVLVRFFHPKYALATSAFVGLDFCKVNRTYSDRILLNSS